MRFERVLLAGCLAGLCAVAHADGLTAAEQATVDRWLGTRSAPSLKAGKDAAAPPIEQLVERLESRLAEAPADASGWALLAQTYAWLGRMADAREAARRATELGVDAAVLDRKLIAAHTESAIAD